MDTDGWRGQIPASDRQRIVDQLVDLLKRDVPYIGHEAVQEIRQGVTELEERLYTTATSQSEYVNWLVSHILAWENFREDQINIFLNTSVDYTDIEMVNPDHVRPTDAGNWRAGVRASYRLEVIIWIINVLKRDFPGIPHEAREELKNIAMRMERRNFTTATSMRDYVNGLTWKMLAWEKYRQDHMSDSLKTSSGNTSKNPAVIGKPFFEEIAAILASGARTPSIEMVGATDPTETGKQSIEKVVGVGTSEAENPLIDEVVAKDTSEK